MNSLRKEIKELIVSTLSLEGVRPDDIADDGVLFGDGLGLDSIDAIELGVAIRKRYGISVSAEGDPRRHFASVATLAAFVAANRTDLK